jgi:hypothetical protein
MNSSIERSSLLAASLTVETALLMPIIFLTVFSCVFLTFQYHNAAAMTANAAETAITGKQQEFPDYIGAGKITLTIDDKRKERTSSVSGRVSSWLNPGKDMTCSQTYKKVNPSHMIRKIQVIHHI